MKAVAITSSGGSEVLRVQEIDELAVGGGEVLIKVEATALNRADAVQRKGLYPPPPCASPYHARLDKNLDSLAMDGRLFMIGFLGGAKTDVNLSCLLVCEALHCSREVEKNIWTAIAAGKVKPVVHKSFALSEAADAHRLMESSSHIGKILLVP